MVDGPDAADPASDELFATLTKAGGRFAVSPLAFAALVQRAAASSDGRVLYAWVRSALAFAAFIDEKNGEKNGPKSGETKGSSHGENPGAIDRSPGVVDTVLPLLEPALRRLDELARADAKAAGPWADKARHEVEIERQRERPSGRALSGLEPKVGSGVGLRKR